ncbi:MAG: hypothetical protein HKN32_10285, partial [Flavobacteriales bacterium]|nr:hypothetical protein [Flavobacteriales bacterium]
NNLCQDLTLKFQDGTYTAQGVSPNADDYVITFEGLNGANSDVTLVGDLAIDAFGNIQGVVFRNLTIIDEAGSGSNLLKFEDVTDVTLENVTVVCEPGLTSRAILLNNVNSATIENCTVTGNTVGVLFVNTGAEDSLIVRNSSFFSETGKGFDIDNSIHYIEFEDNVMDVFNHAIDYSHSSPYIILRNNRFRNHNTFELVDIPGNFNAEDALSIIENNVFHGVGGLLVTNGNFLIRNNVFYSDYEFSVDYQIWSSPSQSQWEPSIDMELVNNIFLARGNPRILNAPNPEQANINFVSDYNVFYAETDNWFNIEPEWGVSPLEQWQEYMGVDMSSIVVEATLDLDDWLKPAVTVQNFPFFNYASLESAPALDIDGNARVGESVAAGPYAIETVAFDGGIFEILWQSECQGDQDFYAIVGNSGTQPLTSFQIDWELGGVAQAPYQFSGQINSLDSDTLLLGTINFDAPTTTEVFAQLSELNGSSDPFPANDAITEPVEISTLNAIMSVGPGMQYASLAEVQSVLQSQPMCGPMEVVLEPGEYSIAFMNWTLFDE